MAQNKGISTYFGPSTTKEIIMKKSILMMILTALPLVGSLIAEQPPVAGSANDPYVMKVYPDGTKVILRWSEIGKSVDNGEKHGGAPRIVAYDPARDGIVPIGAESDSVKSSPAGNSSMAAKDAMPSSSESDMASELSGFYVTPEVGVSVVQDVNLKGNSFETEIQGVNVSGSGTVSYSLNPGIRFDLPLGWNITDWFSLEFAPGVIWNSLQSINFNGGVTVDTLSLSGTPSLTMSGNLIQVPLMANFIFKIPTETKWTPFFGGGIGGNYNYMNINSLSGIPIETQVNFDCWSLGYQAIAGFDYELTKEVSFGLKYIFTGSTQQNFQANIGPDYNFQTTGSFTHTVNLTCTARF